MPIAPEVTKRILGWLNIGTQAFPPLKSRVSRSRDRFARARTEYVKLTEKYHYEQEISRNPSIRGGEPPTGEIEIAVPYDGYEYFTRAACSDITATPDTTKDALIGHLLLSGHGKTDLGEKLGIDNRYGSLAIRIPVDGGTDPLTDDRHTCVLRHDYAPKSEQFKLVPITVDVELTDPDTVDLYTSLEREDYRALSGATDPDSNRLRKDIATEVSRLITRRGTFRSCLWLRVAVSVHLPYSKEIGESTPKITRVSLDWPTVTSLRTLHVETTESGALRHVPTRYNPTTRSVEWSDVELGRPKPKHGESLHTRPDVVTFSSAPMVLSIEHPGELYQRETLDGEIEVEVPGHLLSGTRARLFDGTGKIAARQPEHTSRISCRIRLILDDAFTRRTLSPYQHLHFDEVIPNENRISDIETALADRGFDVCWREPLGRDEEPRHLIYAARSEGPDTMAIWLLVEGRHYMTKRENQVPGGHTYTSEFESGELKVFLYGTLPGASRELTHEMNVLQRALREQFNRVRARR